MRSVLKNDDKVVVADLRRPEHPRFSFGSFDPENYPVLFILFHSPVQEFFNRCSDLRWCTAKNLLQEFDVFDLVG